MTTLSILFIAIALVVLGVLIGFQLQQQMPSTLHRDPALRHRPLAADEIQQLIESGKKIAAIKAIRQQTGWGLKQAKDYVDAYPNVPPIPQESFYTQTHTQTQSDLTLDNELSGLLLQGRKIEAIKHYRYLTGQDLLQAKNYVESIEQRLNGDRA
jgi:ribosomal protein L7/L12